MPDSSELVKNIIYYQKSLDRYSQSREDTKILHCILKLYNMPVTVSHLEETGVGRTVNSLRKLGGEVEDAAKTLVRKWKLMVSGTDETEEPENNSEVNSGESESNSSHKHSDRYRSNDRKERPNRDDRYKHNKKPKYDDIHQSTSESGHKSSSSRYNQQDDDRSSYESENEEDCESGVASESEQSSIDEEEEVEEEVVLKSNKYENDRKNNDKYLKHKESSSERASKPKREPERDRKSERSHSREKSRKHHEHEYRKQKRHDSSSSESSEQPPKPIHTSRDKSSSKRKYDGVASDEEVKKKMSKKSSPSTNDSHQSSNSHRSKESSHGYKKESKSEIDNYSSKSSSHKSKESSSSSSSNRDYKKEKTDSDKRESKNSSKSDSKNEKRKSESSRDEYSKSDEKSKKDSKSDKKYTDKEKSKSKHNSKNNSGSGSSTSTSTSSSKIVDIGSESGTSFAEALGMLEPTTSKTNSKRTKSNEVASYKQDKPERIKEKFLPEKPPKSDIIDILVPPPPPKSDIDINIASLLPSITTNYRPVYNPFIDNQYGRMKIMNDDEALSLVMSQKNLRTKVFSGNKCFFGTVPTLFELCIRVLQDNIDALEYTGGVPYVILKPVLDKATPEQLFMLEHHNPYLIEDSNEIWQFHCQKEFRNKKREEMESWRDMYMRCLDEREAKLKTLTENIKLSQVMSTPVRTAKLAYVDSVVKPPRDVIRKQAKSGIIDKKPNITPSARLSALATAGAAGQVVVPNPVRASSSGGSSAAMKPKKAPLMAKTLQFLKGNRFRR